MMDLDKKEKIEIEYWQETRFENPRVFTASNFLNKTNEARHLHYKLGKYKEHIKGKKNILEIGAGQGWASCFMKRFVLKQSHFTVTDISPHAIEGLKFWEETFNVDIDHFEALRSYEVNQLGQKFDLIFCYAAFHHFVKYKETLESLKSILSDEGTILFLYEPTSSQIFYPLYYKYVNAMPHSTPEDVLIPKEIAKICKDVGLNYTNFYDSKQTIYRSFTTSFYFKILRILPFLSKVLPSSSDMLFTKK